MRDFQHPKGSGNILYSRPVLFLLAILLLFFLYGTISFVQKMLETGKNRTLAETKLTELKEKKERLSADINKLQTASGVEENIREKFGLTKEGEELIVVLENKDKTKVSEAGNSGFFGFLKSWFK